ncbi:MAG: LysR substrate-binding domain-containing protein [Pseudomonadota bacterium]
MRKIRNVQPLRSFEAAARHLSFKRAAEELFVTPTAVSHQIKSLEKQLDCRLFERKTRQIIITAQGQELFTTLRKAFDDIDDAVERIQSVTSRDTVTLGLGPIIGTRWLAPRLGDFWNQHGQIDLRLHHSEFPIEQNHRYLDLAIAWGDGHWPSMEVHSFIDIELTPVMSPSMALPENPKDLLQYPLIHQRDQKSWGQWFNRVNTELPNDALGTVIDDANLALQAALNGQGVALGVLPFIEQDLRSGNLIRPFPQAINPGLAYYLIGSRTSMRKKPVTMVRDWLLEQISETASPESPAA